MIYFSTVWRRRSFAVGSGSRCKSGILIFFLTFFALSTGNFVQVQRKAYVSIFFTNLEPPSNLAPAALKKGRLRHRTLQIWLEIYTYGLIIIL